MTKRFMYCKEHVPFDMKAPYSITENPKDCLHCQWRLEMKRRVRDLQEQKEERVRE